MAVVIETTVGDLTVDLYIDKRPRACLNFLKLCKLKYYNFNLFHNIEHGFIAQTGDPSGVGEGGESVWGVVEGFHKRYFEAESLPKIKHTSAGLLSMVSVGKNMVGSQFFFTLGADLTSLDGVHCVIGEVTEGYEVLRKLNEAIVDEKYRPYQDIRVTHTVILEDPFDDPRGFQIPSRSPSPNPERLKNGRIGADEDIDDTEGKTPQEIQEMLQEREAKARATILEIVGDLPDADIAPPENVLFVCKLNPVTTDDDLEIIFSRFGKVKSCEVIRDKVTGDSLQYAFVEFEDKKACENAYFKMDNVLIDDRRIHVDFSQSVAKVKWRGKGRGIVRDDGKDGGKLDFNNLRGPSKSTKRSKGGERRDDADDYSRNGKVDDSRPERSKNISKSRSRSPTPRRKKSRTRSRSPTGKNNQGRERSDSRPKTSERRGRYGSRSRSPPDYRRFPRDSDYRRPPSNYRNYNRPYGNRGRGRYSGGNYYNSRPFARRYENRRSRSRSNSNRSHERSPNYDRRVQRYEDRRNKHRSRSRDREDNRTKEDNGRYPNDSHQRQSNEKGRQERLPGRRETSSRDKRISSSKKSRKVRKKESSSSSSEETSSSSSESSSSSSEEERKKRRRKKSSKKKSSKKKIKKRRRSTSSSDSSSSDSSSD